MGITLNWEDDQKSILRLDVDGAWTWQQMHAVMSEARRGVPDPEQRLDVIVHVLPHALPPHNPPVQEVHRALRELPENPGTRVFVGSSAFAQTLTDLFNALVGEILDVQTKTANTLDEARQMIAEDRAAWE